VRENNEARHLFKPDKIERSPYSAQARLAFKQGVESSILSAPIPNM